MALGLFIGKQMQELDSMCVIMGVSFSFIITCK